MTSEWTTRPAKPEDLNFIYSSWQKSYQCDSYFGNSARKSIFFENYPSIVDSILARPNVDVVVACLNDNPNVILGYLVFELENILHYCFVKECWRRAGIARGLVAAAFFEPVGGLVFTHRTKTAEPVIARYPSLNYNPFLLFQREPVQKRG